MMSPGRILELSVFSKWTFYHYASSILAKLLSLLNGPHPSCLPGKPYAFIYGCMITTAARQHPIPDVGEISRQFEPHFLAYSVFCLDTVSGSA